MICEHIRLQETDIDFPGYEPVLHELLLLLAGCIRHKDACFDCIVVILEMVRAVPFDQVIREFHGFKFSVTEFVRALMTICQAQQNYEPLRNMLSLCGDMLKTTQSPLKIDQFLQLFLSILSEASHW